MFFKIGVLEGLQFIIRRLRDRCFPVKFAKFLRTLCFTEHLWCLLLKIDNSCFFRRRVTQSTNSVKERRCTSLAHDEVLVNNFNLLQLFSYKLCSCCLYTVRMSFSCFTKSEQQGPRSREAKGAIVPSNNFFVSSPF